MYYIDYLKLPSDLFFNIIRGQIIITSLKQSFHTIFQYRQWTVNY